MRRLLRIPVGLALALTVSAGLLWWWAVLRLVLTPAEAGPVEGAVAVGGWGLGLLPVHCVPGPSGGRRWTGARGGGGRGGDPGGGRAGDEPAAWESVAGEPLGGESAASESATGESATGGAATRASRLHRSGEGSGPS
ncbi:hypothetical protein OG389_27645 [Streptomyces sp. NBC_00435]